jgi:dimethylamine/trimethylamine dehydrogenase
VRDYRTNLIQTMGNVDIYRGSSLAAQDVIEFGCNHAVIATGARWTREILSSNGYPVAEIEGNSAFTPDDVLAGAEPGGPIVIYDFDHYYMGSCLAELLRKRGTEVTIVTPANAISAWTFMNNELANIRVRMIELGIGTEFEQFLSGFSNGSVELTSVFREGDVRTIECGSLIVVGTKMGNDGLYQELNSDPDRIADAGIRSVQSIGDCRAPGTIAHAVYSGHECARTIDAGDTAPPFRWERPALSSDL